MCEDRAFSLEPYIIILNPFFGKKVSSPLNLMEILRQTYQKLLSIPLHSYFGHGQIYVFHRSVLKQILLDKLLFPVVLAFAPSLFYRSNPFLVLLLSDHNALCLAGCWVPDPVSSGLTIWAMSSMDDLIFNLFPSP